MNDTDTFGGFMASFFADFRDEYLKVPSLTFPILSSKISAKAWMTQNVSIAVFDAHAWCKPSI